MLGFELPGSLTVTQALGRPRPRRFRRMIKLLLTAGPSHADTAPAAAAGRVTAVTRIMMADSVAARLGDSALPWPALDSEEPS